MRLTRDGIAQVAALQISQHHAYRRRSRHVAGQGYILACSGHRRGYGCDCSGPRLFAAPGQCLTRTGYGRGIEFTILPVQMQLQRFQHPHQHQNGIAPALDDVHAGVAALQPFHGQLPAGKLHGAGAVRNAVGTIHAARATDAQFSLFLGVEVDQVFAVQPVGLQALRPDHAGFFGGREQGFQRRMLQCFIGQHGQCGGCTNAVVGTQRGAVGRQPAVFPHFRGDGILFEVVHLVGIFLRHHVEVRLQNHAGGIFMTGAGRLAHADVAGRIALGRQAQPFGFVQHVLLHGLFMKRRARNLRELVKILPDAGRLQVMDGDHDQSHMN